MAEYDKAYEEEILSQNDFEEAFNKAHTEVYYENAMANYINKAELKAKIDALHPSAYDETPEWNDGYYSAMNDIIAEATVLPTIDIVHCKECIHRGTVGIDSIDCRNTPDDWYCADGERNNNND